MSEKLEPALTKEEATNRKVVGYPGIWIEGDTLYSDNSGEEYAPDSIPCRTVAALALYNQPFGFTREDVENLRGLELEWSCFNSLADRIEALLPPG